MKLKHKTHNIPLQFLIPSSLKDFLNIKKGDVSEVSGSMTALEFIISSFEFTTLTRHPEGNVAIAKCSEGTSANVSWTLPSSEGQYSRKSISIYYNEYFLNLKKADVSDISGLNSRNERRYNGIYPEVGRYSNAAIVSFGN